MLAGVFSMQGFGQLAASLVSFVLIYFLAKDNEVDLVWRLCLGIGAVPGLMMFYFRVRMPETDRFAKKKKEEEKAATADAMSTTVSSWYHFKKLARKWGTKLFGTAASWCLFDITFYANGLFAATVLGYFGVGSNDDTRGKLIDLSRYHPPLYIDIINMTHHYTLDTPLHYTPNIYPTVAYYLFKPFICSFLTTTGV